MITVVVSVSEGTVSRVFSDSEINIVVLNFDRGGEHPDERQEWLDRYAEYLVDANNISIDPAIDYDIRDLDVNRKVVPISLY